jgi:hypothetical protein
MKAITLLVVLALAVVASATTDQSASTISSLYAYYNNFILGNMLIATYLNCLFSASTSIFFFNDGGSQFYSCLASNGVRAVWNVPVSGEQVPIY